LYFAKYSEEEKMKRRKFLKTPLSYGAASGASLVFLEKGIPGQGTLKSVNEKRGGLIPESWKSKIILGLMVIFSLLTCGDLTINTSPEEENLSKVVIGYYASWEKDTFDFSKIQYKYLTHLAHAFTKPDSEGNLIVEDDYVYPELVETAHLNNVKVIMSIGGWGNCEGFPGMASTAANRESFINQVIEFCLTNNYDGVDIDWEYPSNPEEKQSFVSLAKELSAALKEQNPPLLLTMATPAGEFWAQWINFEEMMGYFDYVGCMTYDFHGEWSDHSGHNSPLYTCHNDPCGSVDDSYEYYLSRQVSKEKLLLGIPFYGRSFDCHDLYQRFKKSQQYGYKEILNFINAGWSYIWDDCAKVPYIRNPESTKIICFDDEQSVALKCRYIKEKEIAGVIIWEISEDYYQGSSLLLEVVGGEFKIRKKVSQRR
jgi:chitinase